MRLSILLALTQSWAIGQVAAAGCKANNLIRAIEHSSDYDFCTAFLAATKLPQATLSTPAYMKGVASTTLSSACSCATSFHLANTLTSSVKTSSSARPTTSSTITSSKKSSTSSSVSSSQSSKMSSVTTTSSQKISSSTSKTLSSVSKSSTLSTKLSSTTTSSSKRSTSSVTTKSTSITSSSSEPTVTFTSVAAQAYASPTTCSSLPIPTSSFHAIPINSSSSTGPYLESIYIPNDNSSSSAYIGMVGSDGKSYLIDLSDPSKVGIVSSSGESMYIDEKGIHFASPNCSLAIDINVGNFSSQLSSQANDTNLKRRDVLSKRFKEVGFAVSLQLTDQCQQQVKDLTPTLSVGPSPCGTPSTFGNGQFTWSCLFPGENSGEMQCEKKINWVLDNILGGVPGSSTNWATIGGLVLRYLIKTYGKAQLLALILAAGIFAGPEVVAGLVVFGEIASAGLTALAVLETAVAVYNANSKNGIAQDMCMVEHGDEFPLPLTLQAGLTTQAVTSLSIAPTSVFQSSVQINDPNSNCCSNAGTCNSYSSCAGSGCYCGASGGGTAFCFQDASCISLAACSSDASCGAGTRCLVGSCCGGGVCISTCSSSSSQPQALFGEVQGNVTSGLTAAGSAADA